MKNRNLSSSSLIKFAILFIFFAMPKINLAQSFTSPISWHHTLFDARVSALGQSTAALSNLSVYNINPAVPLDHGLINISSNIPSITAFDSPYMTDGVRLYSPSVGYKINRFSVSALLDHSSYSLKPEYNDGDYQNTLVRLQSGYQINRFISIGAGIIFSSYDSPTLTFDGEKYLGPASAWGISVGGYFNNEWETSALIFNPQIGLSLNDISSGFKYDNNPDEVNNLPGQIRLGLGLEISSRRAQFDRPIIGLGVYSGFNKYLARWEMDEETSEVRSINGFNALFTTWNSFERYDGAGLVNITLSDQISTSFGIELNLIETLYFRYGVIGGSDYWIHPQTGFGAELDLYYVSLATTRLQFHSSERWVPRQDSIIVQATIRIPIDGQPRDTLIGRLIDR